MKETTYYDIVVVGISYPSKGEPRSNLISQLCSDLSVNGLRVAVITQDRSYLGKDSTSSEFERVDGVDVYRVHMPGLDKNVRLQKIFMFWLFAKKASRLLSKLTSKSILTFLPPLFVSYRCAKKAKRCQIPHLLVLYDIHPDTLIRRRSLSRQNPVTKLLKRETRSAIEMSSAIVAIGRDMRSYVISEYGVSPEKVLYIPNWGSLTDEETLQPEKENADDNKAFTVVYTGNLGEACGLDDLVDSAASMCERNQDIEFSIVGNGRRKKQIEAKAIEMNLKGVKFTDFLPDRDYKRLLRQSSVLVVTLRRESRAMSVPSKLYTYLSAGKPILAIVPEDSEVDLAIKEDAFGISCRNGDSEGIAKAILELKNNEKLYDELSKNAQIAFDTKYRREIVTKKYVQLVKELIK